MGTSFSVPDEILIQILVLMPGSDIQRCRRVCQYLHELIESTGQLQYLIELGYLGYVEPVHPRFDLTYEQKANLLREHRLRGASPSHTFTLETTASAEVGDVKICSTTLCDGIYVEGFSSTAGTLAHRLNLHQLPSWNRGTDIKKWRLELGLEAIHFDLSLDLNLLCLIEIQEPVPIGVPSSPIFDVHLRTLDSNDVHPGAALSKLSWRVDQENTNEPLSWSMSSHIQGNLLGIMFIHRRSMTNYLIIWDWPSGSKLLHIRTKGHAPGSFTIIGEEFVVNYRPATQYEHDVSVGYLDVYQLGKSVEEHPPPIVTLSLPFLSGSLARSNTRFHASPPSLIPLDFLEDDWYQSHPKLYEIPADADHLCLIRCSFRGGVGWLAIPSSTILSVVKECQANGSPDMTMVSWELWGDRTSWVYHADPALHAPFSQLCSGLRTIAGTQADGPTIIWNFDPRTVQSTRQLAESEHGVVPRVCFPKGMGPASWDQRTRLSPSVDNGVFFGDGSLGNQPFCASRLDRRGDSGPTMMRGEHVINIIEPGKIVVSCF